MPVQENNYFLILIFLFLLNANKFLVVNISLKKVGTRTKDLPEIGLKQCGYGKTESKLVHISVISFERIQENICVKL